MRAIDRIGNIIIKTTHSLRGLNAALHAATNVARIQAIYFKPNSRSFKKVYRGHRLRA